MPPDSGYNAPPFRAMVAHFYRASSLLCSTITRLHYLKRKEYARETQENARKCKEKRKGYAQQMQGNIYHASSALSYNFLSGYNAIYHHPGGNSRRITISLQLHLSQRGIIMTLPRGSIEQLKMEPLSIGQLPGRTQELRTEKVVRHFLT